MEKNRLKEEQEKRLQDERTKFIEKTKNLLIFEPVEDDKPKRSGAPAKVCHSKYITTFLDYAPHYHTEAVSVATREAAGCWLKQSVCGHAAGCWLKQSVCGHSGGCWVLRCGE